MLPYTPLHHILTHELDQPVVATSGNVSDEPICIDEQEALERLSSIADFFMVHDRPIARYEDDSIVRVVLGRELVLRRARGYAPLPLHLPTMVSGILAVGGHLKNTVALTADQNVFISQHIGDLETNEAAQAFRKTIQDIQTLYDVRPERIAADMHPDYISTKSAQLLEAPVVSVQHHFAHVVSCMAENELDGPVLGVSWDGTGYGMDGTIWGGEFLLTDGSFFRRVACFRQLKLPGGERAIQEPRRAALGVLYEIFGEILFERRDLPPLSSFTDSDLAVLQQMLVKSLNSPLTSSAGRLFDAVSSLTGVRQITTFEGQAAMELEYAIDGRAAGEPYCFQLVKWDAIDSENRLVVDWEPVVRDILKDMAASVAVGTIAARFHDGLAASIVQVAEHIGEERVVLTGGCFQNKYLTERTIQALESKGFRVYWHQRIPPNDGGLSLGQAVVAARSISSPNR
jgi:hydrogenase maturation protein HypF